MTDEMLPAAPKGRCPTCRKPTVKEHRPFCSKRCADIDLARWLGGTFVIAGTSRDEADDSAGAEGGLAQEEGHEAESEKG
jgi:endogenous inhibitor of DNA gyrase (YacG/DUF329 family)